MEPYIFSGVILPERAQISFRFECKAVHMSSGTPYRAKVSIELNQVVVWVYSDYEWPIFDLRNTVKTLVQNNLDMIGYLKGHAYDLKIDRVINMKHEIDHVFGIAIPCLAGPRETIDLDAEIKELRVKVTGPNGVYLNRCFSDLVSSMKHADDTAFYCYRAIESLRNHCSAVHEILESSDREQWEKFREVSTIEREIIMKIKESADPLRHGGVTSVTDTDREELFLTTWDSVGKYLSNI